MKILQLLIASCLAWSVGAAETPGTYPDLNEAGEFHVYKTVRSLPAEYNEMLRKALDQKSLAMADPGTPFRTGDMIVLKKGQEPLPTRRLIFAAGSEKLRLFYYEVGGYGGGGATVLVFRCHPSKPCSLTWTGVDFAVTHAKTPIELIARIRRHKLEPFDSR